jgi:eukaryotic-like serine/threonine-protein kinase
VIALANESRGGNAVNVHGNLWDWCHGRYASYGAGDAIRSDAVSREAGEAVTDAVSRVLRGGSFSLNARGVRVALRNGNWPDLRNANNGFRPARTL